MAKKITILENAVEKSVSKVAKIKTKLANGRDCYWVPEEDYPLGVLNVTEDGVYNASSDPNGPFYGYSEVNVEGVGNVEMGTLGTITITANGTYEAATDSQGPFYGYSTVIVNVSDEDAAPDHISGKDPDGNDEVVSVDDDGNLVRETVPSSIKIISPPDILTYYDGELIDFHGIYVKGYLEDGTEWGVVPNNELSFPEPIAEWDGNLPIDHLIPIKKNNVFVSDGEELFVNIQHVSSTTTEHNYALAPAGVIYISLLTTNGKKHHVVGFADSKFTYQAIIRVVETGARTVQDTDASYTYTYNGYTLEYVNDRWYDPVPEPVIPTDTYPSSNTIKTILETYFIWDGSTMTVPVQWHRPGDGKSLYDNFEITVNKPDDSGGQDPQPAPTPSPD